MVTWEANHQAPPVCRDTEASRQKAKDASQHKASMSNSAGQVKAQQQPKKLWIRSLSDGGHSLTPCGEKWRCTKCRIRGPLHRIAGDRCTGSAVDRWAAKIEELKEAGIHSRQGHQRMLTDQLVWCNTCGAYANDRGQGMARPCAGPPTQVGGGRWQQLYNLRNCRHPKDATQIGEAIPEPWWADGDSHGRAERDEDFKAENCNNVNKAQSALTPFERIRQRIAAKQRSSIEASPELPRSHEEGQQDHSGSGSPCNPQSERPLSRLQKVHQRVRIRSETQKLASDGSATVAVRGSNNDDAGASSSGINNG